MCVKDYLRHMATQFADSDCLVYFIEYLVHLDNLYHTKQLLLLIACIFCIFHFYACNFHRMLYEKHKTVHLLVVLVFDKF